jgi:hypothetical protein
LDKDPLELFECKEFNHNPFIIPKVSKKRSAMDIHDKIISQNERFISLRNSHEFQSIQTLDSKDKPVKLSHPAGISIASTPVLEKAYAAISFNLEPDSNVTSQRESQLEKHSSPITSTLFGIQIDLITQS